MKREPELARTSSPDCDMDCGDPELPVHVDSRPIARTSVIRSCFHEERRRNSSAACIVEGGERRRR